MRYLNALASKFRLSVPRDTLERGRGMWKFLCKRQSLSGAIYSAIHTDSTMIRFVILSPIFLPHSRSCGQSNFLTFHLRWLWKKLLSKLVSKLCWIHVVLTLWAKLWVQGSIYDSGSLYQIMRTQDSPFLLYVWMMHITSLSGSSMISFQNVHIFMNIEARYCGHSDHYIS